MKFAIWKEIIMFPLTFEFWFFLTMAGEVYYVYDALYDLIPESDETELEYRWYILAYLIRLPLVICGLVLAYYRLRCVYSWFESKYILIVLDYAFMYWISSFFTDLRSIVFKYRLSNEVIEDPQ